jgi:hypothetical protein
VLRWVVLFVLLEAKIKFQSLTIQFHIGYATRCSTLFTVQNTKWVNLH